MSELYDKSLLKLELDRVLEMLSACAGSIGGKEACLRVKPSSDLEDVCLALEQTTAASDLCTKKGNPVFGDVTDVSASLERAACSRKNCCGSPVSCAAPGISGIMCRKMTRSRCWIPCSEP